jgi:hypothetical protein
MSNKKIQNNGNFLELSYIIVFPRSVILIGQGLINFLCVVLNFLNKMYVQSMYMKCITNLILDLAPTPTCWDFTPENALGYILNSSPVQRLLAKYN